MSGARSDLGGDKIFKSGQNPNASWTRRRLQVEFGFEIGIDPK